MYMLVLPVSLPAKIQNPLLIHLLYRDMCTYSVCLPIISSSPCINPQCSINHIRYGQGVLSRQVYEVFFTSSRSLSVHIHFFAPPPTHLLKLPSHQPFLVTCAFTYIFVGFTSRFYSLHFLAFLAVFQLDIIDTYFFCTYLSYIFCGIFESIYKGFDIYVCICWKNLCLAKFVVSSKLKELICYIYLSSNTLH